MLIEKVIRALTLVHNLSNSSLEFIFKGGTSLLLMMDKPSRLSIDIDIIIPKRIKDLENIFQKIVSEGSFIRFEEQERKVESDIEKAHFKFYYNPILVTHSRKNTSYSMCYLKIIHTKKWTQELFNLNFWQQLAKWLK